MSLLRSAPTKAASYDCWYPCLSAVKHQGKLKAPVRGALSQGGEDLKGGQGNTTQTAVWSSDSGASCTVTPWLRVLEAAASVTLCVQTLPMHRLI